MMRVAMIRARYMTKTLIVSMKALGHQRGSARRA
jgi:hypothetical protein